MDSIHIAQVAIDTHQMTPTCFLYLLLAADSVSPQPSPVLTPLSSVSASPPPPNLAFLPPSRHRPSFFASTSHSQDSTSNPTHESAGADLERVVG